MYGARGVLHVMHGGGGTEAYARTLADATRGRLRHVLAMARGDDWRIEEWRSDGSVMHCQFGRRPDEPLEDFLRVLCDVYGCDLVHVHHISGSRALLHEALPRLAVPFVLTVHDLYLACPTITLHQADGFYCGGVTDVSACNACLAAQPDFVGIDIARWRDEHRAVVRAAAAVIAPSTWAADLVQRYFPDVAADVIPHALPERSARAGGAVQVVLMRQAALPTVAIVGAIGPDKGARRVERLAALAADRDAPVRFVVVGYLDRRPDAWQSDDGRLTVHGRYDARDLGTLLDHYGASLVLYPSSGPESFAYTLSEVWQAGRPVLVPPIGALAERVDAQGAGWIMSEAEWRDESRMLDRVLSLIAPDARDALHAASRRAASTPLPTIDAMVGRTVATYERAMAEKPVAHAAVERLRVVEAFGYRRWTPPSVHRAAASQPASTRPTSRLGRWLERLTTPDAARSRLR
jgi:O-antigen biosynthesis protein